MLKTISVLCLCSCLFLASCGTLFNGSHSTVKFDSDPQGAKVYDNGSPIGKTPLEASLVKKIDHNIEFRLEGYESITKMLSSSAGAGFVILDILLGGLIGVVIDAITHDWNGLDAEYVKVAM